MAGPTEPTAATAVSDSDKSKETLSQFIARIFSQLTPSAWLPAAALVLLAAYVVNLGSVLDTRVTGVHEPPALYALRTMAGISLGGAIVLLTIIVVLTVVTQAFAFEAILFLQGYWGTNTLVERIAGWRCTRHEHRRDALEKRHALLTDKAWTAVRAALERDNDRLVKANRTPSITPTVLSATQAAIVGGRLSERLTPAEEASFKELLRTWVRQAPPDLIRQRNNIAVRLNDYPSPGRILPTMLGNLLRRYIDKTAIHDPQQFIQRIYDELPLWTRIEHDEQRSRLDLYCSMVFVLAIVTFVGVIRFAAHHWWYALATVVIGAAAMLLMYRAAITTARHYGEILLVAASHTERAKSTSAGTAPSQAPSPRTDGPDTSADPPTT